MHVTNLRLDREVFLPLPAVSKVGVRLAPGASMHLPESQRRHPSVLSALGDGHISVSGMLHVDKVPPKEGKIYRVVLDNVVGKVTVAHDIGAYPLIQLVDDLGTVLTSPSIKHSDLTAFVVDLGSDAFSGTLVYFG